MKKTILSLFLLNLAFSPLYGQSEQIFATTDKQSAEKLLKEFPSEVSILKTHGNSAAIQVTQNAANYLHEFVDTHGPGYVYKSSENAAVAAIQKVAANKSVLNFTITEEAWVNAAINQVSEENIKNHIQVLENYGTRKHNTQKAQDAANDLKTKWESWITASGRSDISVRLFDHTGTPMPSVILTIDGATEPDDYVIVGGHLDSTSWSSQAPGADDDASGIATISEMIRVLLESNFKPSKTVEFMAFAAEEIGLVGSNEIAEEYASENKNVLAFVQFDMTNYKGSSKDVYLATDTYVSSDLNVFLVELMEHYNASGSHIFTYGNTICNYGCSDHYSWAEFGYNAAFPFEATFNDSNPYIHSTQDKLVNMGNNAEHATKFAKLGLEFIIEAAKSTESLAVKSAENSSSNIFTSGKNLYYDFKESSAAQLQIIDSSGRIVVEQKLLLNKGNTNLQTLKKGMYVAVFKMKNGKVQSKKFLIE